MPTYYPQINGNLIITQLPYTSELAYSTVVQDLETGMRWTYPLRGVSLPGYPNFPLGRFTLNYPGITDAEAATLEAFFNSMRGKWLTFRFLDPSGNLLQFSEDFTKSYWSKTASHTAGQADPFNNTNATLLGSGNVEGVVGPSDGGMQGIVMCASIWAKASAGGVSATIGFLDNSTSTFYSNTFLVPTGNWLRVSKTLVLPTNNQFLFKLTISGGSCTVFGAQVAPTKGESAYVRTPGNYGYHENVRFDTDYFDVNVSGPNQNAIVLPAVEINV